MDIQKKHVLILNSEDRVSGTTEDAVFHLNENDLHECTSVSLKDVALVNTLYNIDEYNDLLVYDINGVEKSITLNHGNYTAEILKTSMNLMQTDLNFTNYATINKFVVTSATPSYIKTDKSTIGRVLGFTKDNAPATVYTGDTIYNLIKTNFVHVISSKLAEADALISSNNKKYSVMATLPLNVPYGYAIISGNDKDTADFNVHNSNLNLSTIDIKLVDDDFNVINLRNSKWTISFNIWRR